MKNTIVIIDYGVGNVRSVKNALSSLGYTTVISQEKRDIQGAACVVLPGVGAFAEGMKNLKALGLLPILHDAAIKNKKPFLGICLGMQLLAESSEEGGVHAGLGYIPGHVVRFPEKKTPRIPHVGWNTVSVSKTYPLFGDFEAGAHYYFDHSFYFNAPKKHVLATCEYGIQFPAAVGFGNIYGVQFHPEKSQANGLKLFRSFFKSHNL
ncbi:imidazole glycerol phosphate synthase subunit HisH [bacterium CG10_46_32]|nr:MAG: imidazole glycerol phosphate synthase subunit HisH [bacterium CG10_46_32]PIR56342.1 MAG: imidazole glycerol phosphate synthase subunit HisH [Parcubacteria group bacterium CG10_big_fil_rev_8_21_14_0_10_46_32]